MGKTHVNFCAEAGLALLQVEGPPVPSSSECPAPASLIKEATILHPFAVAAYTVCLGQLISLFFLLSQIGDMYQC